MPRQSRDVWWGPQIDAVAREISRLAVACDIDIEAPGVGERVLKNDDGVCRRSNPQAFRELRAHLMALFELEERTLKRLGADELSEIVDRVRGSIRELRRLGSPGARR